MNPPAEDIGFFVSLSVRPNLHESLPQKSPANAQLCRR